MADLVLPKMKKVMSNPLGIRGYDYVEFYVGSAKMVPV